MPAASMHAARSRPQASLAASPGYAARPSPFPGVRVPPAVPQAPTGLAVDLGSPPVYSQLQLSWTDNSNNEFGFEIERKVNGGDWSKVAQTLPDAPGYTDLNLDAYTHYQYRVRAVNEAGASDWSNEAAGDTGTRPRLQVDWTGWDNSPVPVGPEQPAKRQPHELRERAVEHRRSEPERRARGGVGDHVAGPGGNHARARRQHHRDARLHAGRAG